jgi:hypothetical protein
MITPFAKAITLKIAYNVRPSGFVTHPGMPDLTSPMLWQQSVTGNKRVYMKINVDSESMGSTHIQVSEKSNKIPGQTRE